MATKDEARRELARRELARRQSAMSGDQIEARDNLAAISPAAPSEAGYSSSILPLSRGPNGVQFDSDAGILGGIKRAFMLPGDVMAGKVDPVSDEGIGRAFEFASTFGPSTPGLRSGDKLIPGEARNLGKAEVPVPSQRELFDQASSDFKAMRETGVDYLAQAVRDHAQTIKTKLEQEGFDPEVAGKTHKILDKLSSPPEGSVANIKGLHSARKTFGKIAQNFNDPSDQSAASQAIKGLDEFISTADEAAVVAGTAADASDLLKSGNANFAAAKRAETLTDLTDAAQLRANAANSGANSGNTTRQRIASLLLNDKASSGYSPEEIAALRGVNEGSFAANATRRAGNMLGGGGGIGASMIGLGGAGLGVLSGSPEATVAGAALPLAGSISRQISNYLTERALRVAEEGVRMRSPMYQAAQEAAPMVAQSSNVPPAVLRAMLLSIQGREQ